MWIEYLPKIGYHVDFALGILRIYLPSAQFYVLNSVKNCSIHCDKIYEASNLRQCISIQCTVNQSRWKSTKKSSEKRRMYDIMVGPAPSLESSRHTNSIPFIIIALVMINLHKLLCPSGHVWLLQWIQTLFVVPFKFLKFIYSEKATKFCEIFTLNFDWHYIGQK